jgi:hypothetical protein
MDEHNPSFSEQMTSDHRAEKNLQEFLRKIGPSNAVERFLLGYGSARTRAVYVGQLVLHRARGPARILS